MQMQAQAQVQVQFQGAFTGSSSTGPSRATDGFDAPLHRRAAKANLW
jgi:hypothetical protein